MTFVVRKKARKQLRNAVEMPVEISEFIDIHPPSKEKFREQLSGFQNAGIQQNLAHCGWVIIKVQWLIFTDAITV